MDLRTTAITFAHKNKDRFLTGMKEFLHIPSISTNPENIPDMRKAADWLVLELKKLGSDNVQIFPTKKHPIVYAEFLKAGADKPTVLVYGHYDVQPADPLDLWETGPFEAVIRGDYLFSRGASDMNSIRRSIPGQPEIHLRRRRGNWFPQPAVLYCRTQRPAQMRHGAQPGFGYDRRRCSYYCLCPAWISLL
jgi:hypothetical protein